MTKRSAARPNDAGVESSTMNWELIGIGVLAALAIFFVVTRRGGG